MTTSDPRAQPDATLRRLHILIADDEPVIVDSLARFFTRRGHLVRTANDAITALGLVDEHRFDVALIDARMPGNGLTVVQHLKGSSGFEGRVVLMTGALAADPAVDVGSEVIRLQKPFRLTDLAEVVEGSGRS